MLLVVGCSNSPPNEEVRSLVIQYLPGRPYTCWTSMHAYSAAGGYLSLHQHEGGAYLGSLYGNLQLFRGTPAQLKQRAEELGVDLSTCH